MLPPLPSGKVLRDRYRLKHVVGRGGMGSVYMAEDLRLEGRLCAVKEIQTDPGSDPDEQAQSREQFHREASTLARLDHPNLPKVSDFFSVGNREYLVMDFVPGDDLKTHMDQARRQAQLLSEATVLGWAEQLADALAYMHSQDPPVIHRDIKPGNLKLTPNGLLKLVDFGLVKLMAPDETTITVVQGRGTAHYTPLEQYGGDTGHTDARSDIYSFGATLYHLLTNQAPAEAKQRFLQPSSLTPVREINPAISVRTQRALLWAMAVHPDERPPDVLTFRDALLSGLPRSRAGLQPQVGWFSRLLPHRTERLLAYGTLVLLLLALVATLGTR